MVDSSTLKMTDRVEQRNKVLSYHFLKVLKSNYSAYYSFQTIWLDVQRYAGKHFVGAKYPDMVRFDPEGKWREVIVKRLKISLDEETNVNTYYMIPLVDNAYRNRLIAIATNFNVKYWVFACVASSWHNSVRYWYVQVSSFEINLKCLLSLAVKKEWIYPIKLRSCLTLPTIPNGNWSTSIWSNCVNSTGSLIWFSTYPKIISR